MRSQTADHARVKEGEFESPETIAAIEKNARIGSDLWLWTASLLKGGLVRFRS